MPESYERDGLIVAGASAATTVVIAIGGLAIRWFRQGRKDRRDDYQKLFDQQQEVIARLQDQVLVLNDKIEALRVKHNEEIGKVWQLHADCREENATVLAATAAARAENVMLKARVVELEAKVAVLEGQKV